MNWIKRIFSKKETTEQCDIPVVNSSSPKKEQTYMYIEEGTGRPYFTNEPPHIKNWCEEQLQKSRKRCRC